MSLGERKLPQCHEFVSIDLQDVTRLNALHLNAHGRMRNHIVIYNKNAATAVIPPTTCCTAPPIPSSTCGSPITRSTNSRC